MSEETTTPETEVPESEGQEVETNPLGMSDDDFNEMPIPEDTGEEEPGAEELPEETTEEGGEEKQPDMEAAEADADLTNTPEPEQDAYSGSEEEEITADKTAKSEEEDTKADQSDTSAVDYKAEYERLLAPFRANGKDIRVASVDDAITLMKMGANYNKKMAGLKPSLRILKMLEKNELLDEQKLSFLIDLDKKDPKAVAKLVADSGVDPLDIDTSQKTDYTPNTYTVGDSEVELDAVLDDIRDTQSFQDTMDIIGNKWDEASKREVVADPNIIRIINDHVAAGVYGQIMGIVENQRMLGKLTNISDLEAYRHVGQALQAQGAFNQKAPPGANTDTKPPASTAKDSKLNDRKRAASPTKAAASKAPSTDYNPLSLPDEEFEKIASSQYM
jgi:hypothetical protein